MSEEQPLASQPTVSQVVMARKLAQLALEALVDECNHFSPVSQTYELEKQAAQLSLAHKQKQFPSTTQSEDALQVFNGLSCSPTLAHRDELTVITYILTPWDCSSHTSSPSDIFP